MTRDYKEHMFINHILPAASLLRLTMVNPDRAASGCGWPCESILEYGGANYGQLIS